MSLSLPTRKSMLRETVIARRDALPQAHRAALSRDIINKLLALEIYRNAQTVMAYMSFGGELSTQHLVDAIRADEKTLALPRIDKTSRTLAVYQVENQKHDLEPGPWGILEPRTHCRPVSLAEIDLVVIPGVAFDAQGGRLGYGAGFYDRLLHGAERPAILALAFDVQLVSAVPMEPHDCFIDGVVTETTVCWRNNQILKNRNHS